MNNQLLFNEYVSRNVSNLDDIKLKFPGEGWRIIVIKRMQRDGYCIYDAVMNQIDDVIERYDKRYKTKLKSYIENNV